MTPLPYLVLAALALGACRDDSGMESTARDLAQRPFTPAGNARAAPPGHCQTSTVAVALAAGQPAAHQIFGRLCLPAGSDHRRVPTVHLAVHGATHSHLYWAWPHRPKTHSYVDHLVAGVYAVFAFDRIGVGRSSHPAG